MRLHPVIAICGAIQATLFAMPASQAQMPPGAENVTETYQDWQIICTQPQGAKRCVITQQQNDSKTNQRVLAVELQPQGDKADGGLILPFGVLLDKGVTVKIGDAELAPPLRYKTCLPQGCLAPLSLDAKAIDKLRKAAVFTFTAVNTAEQPMAISVSLKGFGSVLDRAAVLLR